MKASARQPRLRDRLRESTGDAILAAAEQVFAREGLHGARMEAVASAAGVSVGTLYNYFNDREALLSALIDARGDELMTNVRGALASLQTATVSAQLKAFVLTLFRHFVAHGRFMSILNQGELSPDGKPARRAIGTIKRMREAAAEPIELGIARGEIRAGDSAYLSVMLIGLCKATVIWHERELGTLDFDSLADRADVIVEQFLYGCTGKRRAK